jgi:hypothetical protein
VGSYILCYISLSKFLYAIFVPLFVLSFLHISFSLKWSVLDSQPKKTKSIRDRQISYTIISKNCFESERLLPFSQETSADILHTNLSYFLKIYFNIILLPMYWYSYRFPSSVAPIQTLYALPISCVLFALTVSWFLACSLPNMWEYYSVPGGCYVCPPRSSTWSRVKSVLISPPSVEGG